MSLIWYKHCKYISLLIWKNVCLSLKDSITFLHVLIHVLSRLLDKTHLLDRVTAHDLMGDILAKFIESSDRAWHNTAKGSNFFLFLIICRRLNDGYSHFLCPHCFRFEFFAVTARTKTHYEITFLPIRSLKTRVLGHVLPIYLQSMRVKRSEKKDYSNSSWCNVGQIHQRKWNILRTITIFDKSSEAS